MAKKMRMIMYLGVIFLVLCLMLFSISAEDAAVKCGGSTCPTVPTNPNPVPSTEITCSDTDGYYNENRIYVSEVFDKKGTCTDQATSRYYDDYCKNINVLVEFYCNDCMGGACYYREHDCPFGCDEVEKKCNTKDEFVNKYLKKMDIERTGIWCIDGDGQDMPPIDGRDPIPLNPQGCDAYGDNGRTEHDTESFCIDSGDGGFIKAEKVYFDRCDENRAVFDYYCSDEGFCLSQDHSCKAGCNDKKATCNPVPPYAGKLCINPDSDILCDMNVPYSNLCCPEDKANYPIQNGPKNYYDCLDAFFLTRIPSAIDLEQCSLVCCCEFYYDDDNTKQIEITQDKFAMQCKGADKIPLAIGSSAECTIEKCQSSDAFKSAIPTIDDDLNRYLDAIKEGRGCRIGRCAQGLFCRPDLNNAEKSVCCREGSCVNNNICVAAGTEATKTDVNEKRICTDSQWVSSTNSGGSDNCGCPWSERCRNRDLGIAFIPFAFIALFAARKILPKKNI